MAEHGGGCGSRDKENTLQSIHYRAWKAYQGVAEGVARETKTALQSMESLLIIDFSSPDRLATVKELTKAMETVGFVYLDNVPGFNKEVEESLHKAASWFFSLPIDEKLRMSPKKWNPDAKGVYRGYVPINEAEDHLREQYEMGEIERTQSRSSAQGYLHRPKEFLQRMLSTANKDAARTRVVARGPMFPPK